MMTRLNSLHVAGFRSLRDVTLDLTASNLTVLIGPNGAGKSNILAALEMVRFLAFGSLQLFVSERGGASFLMHGGAKRTAAIDLRLEFSTDGGQNKYEARLGYGADESLLFLSEVASHRANGAKEWRSINMGAGHRESALLQSHETTAKTVLFLLKKLNYYHFHDTSRNSPLRTLATDDGRTDRLRSDGSNLPAFLLALMESEDESAQAAWRRIQGIVQQVAPFITRLEPAVDRKSVRLGWKDDTGAAFGPAHLSDGTLRAIALVAALAQPRTTLPWVSSVDEPELGLHPAAIGLLCGLMQSVATDHQVIVATQSPLILDAVDVASVVVVEREAGATAIRRLDPEALKAWLEEYSLAELFDKGVLGGRP